MKVNTAESAVERSELLQEAELRNTPCPGGYWGHEFYAEFYVEGRPLSSPTFHECRLCRLRVYKLAVAVI